MYGRQEGRRPGFDAFSELAIAPIPERIGQLNMSPELLNSLLGGGAGGAAASRRPV